MIFKKKCLLIIFLLLIVFLIIPQIHGISTMPPAFEISYSPGSYQEFQSKVWDVEDLNVSFNGFLVERGEVLDISKDDSNVYTVRWGFKMPEDLAPGVYDPLILFKENPPPRKYGEQLRTGVSAVAAVGVPVKFFIPYPDKYLSLISFEWDQEVEKGGILFFKAELRSMGEKTIEKVKGTAKIFGWGEIEYSAPFTSAEMVQLGEKVELFGEWVPPANLSLGKYKIMGEINYDGIELTTPEYYFTYGDKFIEIISLSPLEIEAGKITLMELEVKNFWNDKLSFSAEVKAYDVNNSLVRKMISTNALVGRHSEATVPIYLDASSWKEGTYRLDISLNYEGELSSKSFLVKAISPIPIFKEIEKPSAVNVVLLIMVIILVLVILSYGLWRYFQNKTGEAT